LGDSGDIELYNQRLKRELRLKSPVEPTEDILRYIIDNSKLLEDWHKDILEMLREEGRQLWASVQTHFMNEGWSVMIHEKVMDRLFDMRLLTTEEHGSYNYSNSRIKAKHPTQLNPYLVGSNIWYNIEERWNKGMHGQEWEDCTSIHEKENWDTGAMEGWKKCKEVQRSYTDWFFFQDFFTEDLVDQLELYLWGQRETMVTVDTIRTRHTTKEIRNAIISSFSHNRVPKIEVIDGNFRNGILLTHRHTGPDLDMKYTIETMKHIFNVTGQDVYMDTIIEKKRRLISVFLDKKDGQVKIQILEKQGAPSAAEAGTGGNPGTT
jgi:stage V sporulation protein R